MSDQPTTPPPCSFLNHLEAYVPGEQPGEPGWVKLNTNEFPYPAAGPVVEAVQNCANDLVRVYPNPKSQPLRVKLAERHGLKPEQVLVGNGSDEILRLLAHAWLSEGRKLAVVEPTYTLYDVLAAMYAAQVEVYPLEDGGERLPEALFEGRWDACFLPVPNPPLGTVFPMEDLRRLASTGRLLVLDGAYVEFTAKHDPLPLLAEFPNVVLSRTFSKSHGLAGMRVGYAMGSPAVIGELDKIRDSYNVNRVSQAAAMAALEAHEYYKNRCMQIVDSRNRLTEDLRERGFRVHESEGNFVFARHTEAAAIYEGLKARKVLVRYFRKPGLEDGLRITIGTPQENRSLVAALDEVLAAVGARG